MELEQSDFSIHGSLSLYTLYPRTHAGKRWAMKHLTDGLPPRGFIPVEHRFIGDICRAILRDGLTMELDGRTYYENDEGELVTTDI